MYKSTLLILTNTGEEKLYLTNLILSCECMEVVYTKRLVSPGDTIHLYITFRPDVAGQFIRNMYVYGNFAQSPMELEMKGNSMK